MSGMRSRIGAAATAGLLVATAMVGGVVASLAVAPAPAGAAYGTSAASFGTLSCTGWVAATSPTGAIAAEFTITGGGGRGGGQAPDDDNKGNPGGDGGKVTGRIALDAGEDLFVWRGCGGTSTTGAEGYSDGGNGSGAGGGATALCVGLSSTTCDVVAIAGGGGGGGRASDDGGGACASGHDGGDGGDANAGTQLANQNGGTGDGGGAGINGSGGEPGRGGGGGGGTGVAGTGGTAAGANTGGKGGTVPSNNESANGGNGGNSGAPSRTGGTGHGGDRSSSNSIDGGGGGGGYTGGGGGSGGARRGGIICYSTFSAAGGGGGGSSWAKSVVTNRSMDSTGGAGGAAGNGSGTAGSVTASFVTNPAPTGGAVAAGNATKGVAKPITLPATDGETGFTCSIVGQPTKGSVSLGGTSSCTATYTAAANTIGADSFTYKVTDDDGRASSTYTVSLTVVNQNPVGASQTVTATKGVALPVTLAASDPDGDAVRCVVDPPPSKGSFVGSGCSWTYTADAGTSGTDTLTYGVLDDLGGTSVHTVTITIANRVPTSVAQSITVAPGSETPLALGGSDPDGDATTCAATTPAGGSLSALDTCTPTYTAPTTLGTDTFTYTRSDAFGGTSTAATITVLVASPDVAITKSHVGVFDAGEQGTYAIGVTNVGNAPTSGTITVIDDLPLGMTYASSSTVGSGFSCTPQLGGTRVSCTRAAALGAGATVDLTITVNLEEGAGSGTNTATVSATPDHSSSNDTAVDPTEVNLRPEAFPLELSTEVDAPVAVDLVGVDPEGGELTYVVGAPTTGGLSGTAPSLLFTPTPGSDLDASFTYTVVDPHGHASFAVTVTIRVTRPGTRGRVVSDADGLGVGGITVRLYQDGVGFTSYAAETDGLGYYDLGDQVEEGTYRVIFRDPGQDHVDEWYDDSLLRSTSTPIEIVAGEELIVDAGLAVGARIDVAISNQGTFTVALYNSGPVGVSAYRSVPSVGGSVSLRGLPAGSYYLSVADPTGALVTQWSGETSNRAAATAVPLAAGATATTSFGLLPPETIAGTVLDSEGPVAGVTVQAYNALTGVVAKSAKTDAQGEYVLRGLSVATYKVVFRDVTGAHPVAWHGPTNDNVISGATPVPVTKGSAVTIDRELEHPATISGTVTGGPAGTTPLAGAKVTLYRNGAPVRTYTTDAAGTYTATGLTPGGYAVLFVGAGHRSEYNLDQARKLDADVLDVDSGAEVTVDATLTAL